MAKKARVYDGTAWQELASAQTDLTAYSTTAQMNDAIAAVPKGLTLISSTAVSGAVSHSFGSNASPIFTSDYRNYRIIIDNLAVATSAQNINFRLRADTTDLTAANYEYQSLIANSTTVSASRTGSQTSLKLGIADQSVVPSSIVFDITVPQLALYKNVHSENVYIQSGVGPRLENIKGNINSNVAYNGFTIFAGTNISGQVSIYGYDI